MTLYYIIVRFNCYTLCYIITHYVIANADDVISYHTVGEVCYTNSTCIILYYIML